MLKLNYNLMFILVLIKIQLQVNFIFKEIKIYQNQDLIITSFIKDKSFVLNLFLVTSNITFKAKLVKLTISVKLMSILTNLSKLSKLARSTIELIIEQESSIYNNKLFCNLINYYYI